MPQGPAKTTARAGAGCRWCVGCFGRRPTRAVPAAGWWWHSVGQVGGLVLLRPASGTPNECLRSAESNNTKGCRCWCCSVALVWVQADGCFGGCLGRARGRSDDELEPADRLAGGTTAVIRLVRWLGGATEAKEACGGRPVGSGEAIPRFSPLVSLCGRCFVSWPSLLALAFSARCLVCLGCRWRACGCTDGRCRSEGRRTSAPAGSWLNRPKSAGQPGRGRFGGGRPG